MQLRLRKTGRGVQTPDNWEDAYGSCPWERHACRIQPNSNFVPQTESAPDPSGGEWWSTLPATLCPRHPPILHKVHGTVCI